MYLAIEGGGEREERERERLSRGFEIVFPSPFHTDGYWRLPGTANPINVRLAKVLGTVPESFLAAVPMAKGPLMGPIGILGRNFDWIFLLMSFILWNRFGILDAIPLPLSRRLCFGGSVAASSKSQTCRLEYWSNIYIIYIYLCVMYICIYNANTNFYLHIYNIYIY